MFVCLIPLPPQGVSEEERSVAEGEGRREKSECGLGGQGTGERTPGEGGTATA